MNIVLAIEIFSYCFYLHIFYQLKTSNDLEYIKFRIIGKLEEICDSQPVLFNFTNENIQNQLT